MSKDDELGGPARYYANPAEQKVLIAGLQRYFALPERSQNRNRVAKEISQYLRFFSPHWSHRAVRLWFNNNKHTYFGAEGDAPPAAPSDSGPPPAAPPLSPSLPAPPPPPAPPPAARIPLPQLVPPPDARLPAPNPPIVLPPFQVSGTASKPPFVSLPSLPRPPTPTQFQSLNPISFWPRATGPEASVEQSYLQLSSLLTEIKRTPEADSRSAKLIHEFDLGCTNLFARSGTIQAEKVDAATRFCAPPQPKEPSQFDLRMDLPESISASDMLDLPLRSLSFSQQLYAGDVGRREAGESAPHVWQARPFTDTNLVYFESATLTRSVAALAFLPFGGIQRSLSVNRYGGGRQRGAWSAHAVPVHAPVESMVAASNCVYLLTNDHLFRAPLERDGKTESAAIPATAGGRFVTTFADGAVAGFHSSPQLLYVAPQFALRTIPTQYRGVMCLEAMQELLLCGVIGSSVIRLVSAQGHECRCFVGHCAPVMKVVRLGLSTFASSADDGTVRVWDLRDRFPVLSVTSRGVSIVNIAGSEEVLVSALHDKTVNVFDLRNAGKPMLAVMTQDYEAVNLQYNRADDVLAMFGVVEKEASRDSMMFVDNEGQSRQRIFRLYEGFVGGTAGYADQ
jgi:hypothetical protein